MTNPPKQNEIWGQVRSAYQRGEGSCNVLAQRFGLSVKSISNRCTREGWKRKGEEIRRKVEEKTEEKIVDAAVKWVDDTLRRCEKYRAEIDAAKEQLSPAVDPGAQVMFAKVEKIIDDMYRRSSGMPDAPQKLEHSGSIVILSSEQQEQARQDFEALMGGLAS